jgi:hypothetical protein
LSVFEQKRRWTELDEELNNIKDKNHLGDLYNYFKGRLISENENFYLEDASYYFESVRPESEYYITSQTCLVFQAVKKYGNYSEKVTAEFSRLATNMELKKVKHPYYFVLKLSSFDRYNYSTLDSLYNRFKAAYTNLYDFSSYQTRLIASQTGEVAKFEVVYETFSIPAVCYFFQCFLGLAAHNQNRTVEKNNALAEIDKISSKYLEEDLIRFFRDSYRMPNGYEYTSTIVRLLKETDTSIKLNVRINHEALSTRN